MIQLQTIYPLGVYLGTFFLSAHVIADFLAFTCGYQLFRYFHIRHGDVIDEDNRLMLVVAAAAGALIGSRLLAALESPSQFLHPPSMLYYVSGSTIVGGLLGGVVAVELTKWLAGIRIRTGDQLVFPIILGMCIGRVGCFLTGVYDNTVGLPSSLPWAFDQGDGVLRHPTSAYEIITLVLTVYPYN